MLRNLAVAFLLGGKDREQAIAMQQMQNEIRGDLIECEVAKQRDGDGNWYTQSAPFEITAQYGAILLCRKECLYDNSLEVGLDYNLCKTHGMLRRLSDGQVVPTEEPDPIVHN